MSPVLYYNRARPKTKEMMIAFMRHYQNTCQDNIKQDALNLLLGLYKPTPLDFNPKWIEEDGAQLLGVRPKVDSPHNSDTETSKMDANPLNPDPKPAKESSKPFKTMPNRVSSPQVKDHPPAPTGVPPPCPPSAGHKKESSSSGRKKGVALNSECKDEVTYLDEAARRGRLASTCKRFDLTQDLGFVIEADAPASDNSERVKDQTVQKEELMSDEKDKHSGLKLAHVKAGGQAALLGVQPGWVLDAVAGTTVQSPLAFHQLIGTSKARGKKHSVVLRFRVKAPTGSKKRESNADSAN